MRQSRSGFTMIELIFVIVIIGILAATAIPKFVNLKQSAEANNIVKAATDAMSGVPSSAINLQDLEGNNSFKLKDIMQLSGKGWSYSDTGDGIYDYNVSNNGIKNVVEMNLSVTAREFNVSINCDNLVGKTSDKCKQDLNASSLFKTITY